MNSGCINLILGCMFSGKTSELYNRYRRYQLGGRKCLMVKYKGDTRYSDTSIVTHDGIKVEAFVCRHLSELEEMIHNFDVICIDEIQFYEDAHIYCDKWANMGKIIEVCGLNGKFDRRPWTIISELIPLVENITFLKAVSIGNGKDAVFSKRLTVDNRDEIIGGSDIYKAVDRLEYFNNLQ